MLLKNYKRMKLFCEIKLDPPDKELLKTGTSPCTVLFSDELPEDLRHTNFLESDICFGNVPSSWLEETTSLKWIQLESVGFGEYQHLGLNSSILMTSLKGFFDIPVAETIVSGILALYRGIDRLVVDKQNKRWEGATLRPDLRILKGTKVLILGGGTIGQRTKKLLSAFDADISIYDKYRTDSDVSDLLSLDDCIKKTDVLISCLPETEETIGILDRSRLSKLKRDALFVNVGRGSVVDEIVLIDLLMQRKIGGCVLDVTGQEPLPEEHPLWECPNTILTQHTGGGYENEVTGKVNLFLENLKRFNQGKNPRNLVDLKKGY